MWAYGYEALFVMIELALAACMFMIHALINGFAELAASRGRDGLPSEHRPASRRHSVKITKCVRW